MSGSSKAKRCYEPNVFAAEDEQLDQKLTELSNYLSDEDEATDYKVNEEDTMDKELLRDMSCVVVVDNMPISHKVGKLEMVMKKVFGQVGEIKELLIPTEKNKDGVVKTIGIAFLQFGTKDCAVEAVKKINGWKLDKRHTFVVNAYDDVQNFLQIPEKYTDPSFEEFSRSNPTSAIPDKENLLSWLTDKFQRDQFVVRYAKETAVSWCEYNPTPPVLVYDGAEQKKQNKNWCELFVNWSPRGSYLATFHHPGIALWGGDSWKKLMRFGHTGVQFLTFSPQENFLITWNGATGAKSRQAIKIFNVKTGQCMRTFTYTHVPEKNQWPNFKWSSNDQFFARLHRERNTDLVQVYETATMRLLDGRSHRAPGIVTFKWSPSDNVMCYWSPEDGETPARITLVEFPSRKIIKQKNLFNVVECQMHWHPQGHYLCVQVTRHSKTKKKTYTSFEIFRMRTQKTDDDVPLETFELKERVDNFAWETNGHRFAIVHSLAETKANVSFYTMHGGKSKKKMELLHTHEDRPCNKVFWSPMGNYCVLAGLNSPHNGLLEFYDVDAAETLGIHEHFSCTNVDWDPSGRICASVVSQNLNGAASMRLQMESGYILWSFQGTQLHPEKKEDFYQFEWRPRPPTLLTAEMIKTVLDPKNLKEQKERFRQNDKLVKNSREAMEARTKIKMRDEFRASMARRRKDRAKSRDKRVALLGYDEDDASTFTVVLEDYSEVIEDREDVDRAP